MNTKVTSNAAMCVQFSRNQLGACGCWWIFDERMDPLLEQVEYSVHTHSHMRTLTDTVVHRYTHPVGPDETALLLFNIYTMQVLVVVILERTVYSRKRYLAILYYNTLSWSAHTHTHTQGHPLFQVAINSLQLPDYCKTPFLIGPWLWFSIIFYKKLLLSIVRFEKMRQPNISKIQKV